MARTMMLKVLSDDWWYCWRWRWKWWTAVSRTLHEHRAWQILTITLRVGQARQINSATTLYLSVLRLDRENSTVLGTRTPNVSTSDCKSDGTQIQRTKIIKWKASAAELYVAQKMARRHWRSDLCTYTHTLWYDNNNVGATNVAYTHSR